MAIIITLPNAIKQLDGVRTKEVEIEEMTGEEEDILADLTRKPGGKGVLARSSTQRMTDILSRCTRRIGVDVRPDGKTREDAPDFFAKHWNSAILNDRGVATIRLRQLSLGDNYVFADECPECGKELPMVSVNLAELKVTDKPIEEIKDTYLTKLPSGAQAEWRSLTGNDEERVSMIIQTRKSDYLTNMLQLRLVTLNGKSVVFEDIKRLRTSDRQFLIGQFDKVEGGIDTDVEIVCDSESCGATFDRRLNVGNQSFFFPSASK